MKTIFRRIKWSAILILLYTQLHAQKIFTGSYSTLRADEKTLLTKTFKRQTIVQLPVEDIDQYIKKSGSSNFILKIGDQYKWDIDLAIHEMRSPDYLNQRTTEKGVINMPRGECITYAGSIKGRQEDYVRFNVQKHKVTAMIRDNKQLFYIEPLQNFVKGAHYNLFIVYRQDDELPKNAFCGGGQPISISRATQNKLAHLPAPQTPVSDVCRKIEIATESDYENFQNGFTSSDATALLNLVEPLYTNSFQAIFVINYHHEWAVAADPYSSNTLCVVGDRLTEFANYWNVNDSTVKRDIAILFSGVDFAGGTVGCAYLGAFNDTAALNNATTGTFCVVQIVSESQSYQKVVTAHEMGHIFGAAHDATGCDADNSGPIMCPYINKTNVDAPYWSTVSSTSITNGMNGLYGSQLLRKREIDFAFSTPLIFTFSGNDVYCSNSMTTDKIGLLKGSITVSGTDSVTLLPGFSAAILNGADPITVNIGPCIDGAFSSPSNIVSATDIKTNYSEYDIDKISVHVYPNPFSNSTKLLINLPRTAKVSISVYDLAGRLADKPVSAMLMPAGKNSYTYTNSKLSSGAYLIVVDADGKRFSERVVKL